MSDDRPLEGFACASPDSPFSDGEVQLAYGENPGGTIVHVNEVSSGLACGCVCPACGDKLVAHRGPRKRYHFAHLAGAECRHATETALHKLAKQLLDRRRVLALPVQRAEVGRLTMNLHPGGEYSFDGAVLEQRLGDIVPDLILRKGDRELLVEFGRSAPVLRLEDREETKYVTP